MLADLTEAIANLDIPVGGDGLIHAIALRDQLDARIAEATGVHEASGWWAGDAAASFEAWLRAQAKMTRRSAAGPDGKQPQDPARTLHLSCTLDDRYVLDGSLDPGGGAVVATALRLATPERSEKSAAARRADALVDICPHFLDHQQSLSGGRHRPHVNVVVELEDLIATGAVRSSTDRCSTGRPWRECSATAPSTEWSCPDGQDSRRRDVHPNHPGAAVERPRDP